jgi:long-chain acyl-CoA synthetase
MAYQPCLAYNIGKWEIRLDICSPLMANARLHGSRQAIACADRRLTWLEFRDCVARIAAVLATHGIARGDRIGILADNCELYMASFFAAPWLGATLVPFNTRLSASELAELIDLSRPAIILHDQDRAGQLGEAIALAAFAPKRLALRGESGSLESAITQVSPHAARCTELDLPASIFFTGGTTGRSKGALTTHRTHLFNSLAMWAALGANIAEARYLHVPPMFHVADALFVHSMTLVGAQHIILPRFEPTSVIAAIAEHRITDVYLVPTMIVTFLDELERNPRLLPSLERIYYGAMPMPEATARRLLEALPHVGPVQLYGQSESGPVLTLLKGGDHDTSGKSKRIKSAGQPLPGVELAIVDTDGGELAAGEVGEIVARSPGVMPGYWDDPEQTSRALREGWLHTGDAGYIDEDGFLFVVDRIKDMIISGGENIYSIEVERAIALHPAVAQCAVVGVPDPDWGERVHAAIVLREDARLTEQELQAHCRQHIAGYKLPRSFDWRLSMPLSGPGKILKRVLRDQAVAAQEVGIPRVRTC